MKSSNISDNISVEKKDLTVKGCRRISPGCSVGYSISKSCPVCLSLLSPWAGGWSELVVATRAKHGVYGVSVAMSAQCYAVVKTQNLHPRSRNPWEMKERKEKQSLQWLFFCCCIRCIVLPAVLVPLPEEGCHKLDKVQREAVRMTG